MNRSVVLRPAEPFEQESEEFVKSDLERNGGGAGSAMLVVDNAHYSPIGSQQAFLVEFRSRGCPILTVYLERSTLTNGKKQWNETQCCVVMLSDGPLLVVALVAQLLESCS